MWNVLSFKYLFISKYKLYSEDTSLPKTNVYVSIIIIIMKYYVKYNHNINYNINWFQIM